MPIEEGKMYGDETFSPGRVSRHHPAEYTRTLSAEGKIKFGYGVVQGSSHKQAKVPSAATDTKFLGIAVHSTEASNIENDTYKANDAVAVQESGFIIVLAEKAIDPNNPVHLRIVGENAGQFTDTPDPGKTISVLLGARFMQETSEAGPVEIQLHSGAFYVMPD